MARVLVALVVLVAAVSGCSDDGANAPRSPDGTAPDGLWLMVMNDCEKGDCDEPAVGIGGRWYPVISCEPVDEAFLGEPIAAADPESVITVYYDQARPIDGMGVEQVVAVGPQSPSGCDDRELTGWFAVRSVDHLDDEALIRRIANLAPGTADEVLSTPYLRDAFELRVRAFERVCDTLSCREGPLFSLSEMPAAVQAELEAGYDGITFVSGDELVGDVYRGADELPDGGVFISVGHVATTQRPDVVWVEVWYQRSRLDVRGEAVLFHWSDGRWVDTTSDLAGITITPTAVP